MLFHNQAPKLHLGSRKQAYQAPPQKQKVKLDNVQLEDADSPAQEGQRDHHVQDLVLGGRRDHHAQDLAQEVHGDHHDLAQGEDPVEEDINVISTKKKNNR